jgi:hypothetical protein
MLMENNYRVQKVTSDILEEIKLYETDSFLRRQHLLSQSSKSLYFTELEGSLPCYPQARCGKESSKAYRLWQFNNENAVPKPPALDHRCCQSLCTLHFNLLNPTGYVMHQQFNIQQFTFCPHTVFMCFVFI